MVSDKKCYTFAAQEKMGMKERKRPVILVTNDDGITAPGIINLVEAVKDLGEIVVVAPDKPQSGMGHAITIGVPLRLHKVNFIGDIEAYQCTGTPVDCVKIFQKIKEVIYLKEELKNWLQAAVIFHLYR